MQKILIVDDNSDMCQVMSRFLVKQKYAVSCMTSGKSALEWLKKNQPDLVLCSLKLADMAGIRLMATVKEAYAQAVVIITADHSNAKDAVEVLKSGAYDYIVKPLFPDEILLTIKKALSCAQHKPVCSVPAIKANVKNSVKQKTAYNDQYIAGDSPVFAEITKQVTLVAPTNYSVIIYGESGSGKEAIAQQIHQESKRANKPFVAIDCGALSRELAGSELFGHEKGAFTGALNQKIGSFEIADEGTIFLDEIGNLPYDIQVSLLRVVQERRIRRVGGTKDIDVDVRIIIASNVNLLAAAKAGKFREDLYHRFNEFNIEVPSLQERKNDIMLFANHFLNHTNAELGKSVKGFTREAEFLLSNYIWSGNIRELKNVVKRATLITTGDLVEATSLPSEIINYFKHQFESPLAAETQHRSVNVNTGARISYEIRNRKTSLLRSRDTAGIGLEAAFYEKIGFTA